MKKFLYLTLILFTVFAVIMASCDNGNPSPITITFDTDGGGNLEPIEIGKGGKLPADYFGEGSKVPTKTGNRFNGWKNGETAVTAATKFSASATLKAQWIRTVTVIFNLGAGVTGNPPASVTVDEGTAMGNECPANPERAGYDFDGWYNGEDFYNKTTLIETDEATLTLTAKWEAIDNADKAYAPAIHPGRHFAESYPVGLTVKAGVEFTIQGLNSNLPSSTGFLTAKWYRATTEANAVQYNGDEVGDMQSANSSSPTVLTLRYTGIEAVVGEYWYWVEVTNTDTTCTPGYQINSTRTMNQLKVTVNPNDGEDGGDE